MHLLISYTTTSGVHTRGGGFECVQSPLKNLWMYKNVYNFKNILIYYIFTYKFCA